MVRKSLLKRAGYFSLAIILAFTAVPVIPNGRAFADEGDCIDKGYKLQNWAADTTQSSEATICSGLTEDFKASLTVNRDLTIDLNGQTWLTNLVVNAGKIVTIKNGTLTGLGQSYSIFNKGGILTLEDVDVNVYGSYDALRNESGVATIDGGTYAGKINATGGKVTINDGEFEGALAGAVMAEGGKYYVDPTAFVGEGKDAYAFDGYWMVGEEATVTASNAIVPVGTKVEIGRVSAPEFSTIEYVIKNSAGGDASSDVTITEEVSGSEKVIYATGLAQGRKEIDITTNSGKTAHATLKVYEFLGVEDQVIFKGESLPMEISSNKWNVKWSLTGSSDENVATVSDNTVTAVSSGKTTVTAQFNDTVNSEVTFDVYVYDFDETDNGTILIEKGASATVNTDSNWEVSAEASTSNVTLTEQQGSYSVAGVTAGDAEITFSMTVNGREFSKTVKAYVYEVTKEDVLLQKGKTLSENDVKGIINTGSDDVTMSFDSFGTDGVASNNGVALTGESAGNTTVNYQLSVDGAIATATFNLHVWDFVTENLQNSYELGNDVTATGSFKVYDNNGEISYTVKKGNADSTDVVVKKSGDNYTIEVANLEASGTYTVTFTDTVLGQEVAMKSVRVRVHQIVVPGNATRYIVMDESLLGNYGTLYLGQVRERNNYTRSSNLRYRVSGGTGLNVIFVAGTATLIASKAGSYTVTFYDDVASSSVTVHVLNFTFGQDEYHIKRGDGTVIEAINEYWHEINVNEGYVDTKFTMVRDSDRQVVAESDGYEYVGSKSGATSDTHTFKWCNTDDCLEAGDYTITFEAYANRGTAHGGGTATKSVRLHIYEMVAPTEDLYIVYTGDTQSIDVHDKNRRGTTRAEIASGPEGGLEFATTGFWIFQETDYSRVIASKPGVYTVEYTDYMGNGAVVGTYEATIIVLEVEEEELFVRRGETIALSGSKDWSASHATDDDTGVDYEADGGEISFDTTGMDLGEHWVYIAHDFSEYDDGEFPPRELVKVTTVVVYDVVGDETDDMDSDADREAVADFLADKVAEMIENDSTSDSQVVFAGYDDEGNYYRYDIDDLKSLLRSGVELETRLVIELVEDEEEWEWTEAYDEVLLTIEDESGIVAVYRVFLFIYAGDEQVGLIYELDDPITLRLLLPEALRAIPDGYTRTFSVVRGHLSTDGLATAVKMTVAREGDYLVFLNDKFSSFAVSYDDELIPVAPDTGFVTSEGYSAVDNSLVAAIAGMIAAFTLAGAAVFAKRK